MKLTSARTGLFLPISALLAPASALAQQTQAAPQAPATEQAAAPTPPPELDAGEVRGEYTPNPKTARPATKTNMTRQNPHPHAAPHAHNALSAHAAISASTAKKNG